MSSQKYETQTEKGIDVAVSASYSGLVSVGGGFSMDSSQKEKASDFSKSVETKTISVGAAPPANGDAMTWASAVKNSPVPSYYKLSSIDKLFTEKYLDGATLNVNLAHIAKTINEVKQQYCLSLLSKGEVESCESLSPGLMLDRTIMSGPYHSIVSSYKECIDHCLELLDCVAITMCTGCEKSSRFYHTCFMYNTDKEKKGKDIEEWKSVIFIGKAKEQLVFNETEVKGNVRSLDIENKRNITVEMCQQLCEEDAHCIVFSYCDCDEVEQKCKLYSFDNVEGFKDESRTKTVFVVK